MNLKEKIKPSFDTNRQVLGEIYPLDTPFTVIIDISEACQFRCSYCFRSCSDKDKWGYASKNNLMEWNTFCKVIDQLSEFPRDLKQISLSNHGEPLCNRKLPQMVKYIKNKGIKGRISIHTNASLLDESYSLELAESGIDRVVVSLQGLNGEKYRDVCGAKIRFDDFYNNLKILYENKKNTEISIKIADVALDRNDEEKFYHLFEPIADRVFVEKIVPIWKDVDIKNGSKVTNKYGDEFEIQDVCPLIFNTLVVTPIGDVYPCTQLLYPEPIGNININSLNEIWNSEKRKTLLIKQCKKDTMSICNDCYIKQNSVYSKEDMIDEYRDKILMRLINGSK